MSIRKSLIAAGVRNLQEFGYGSASPDNILSDSVFAIFFVSMLKDNLGHSADHDFAINELLAEIAVTDTPDTKA